MKKSIISILAVVIAVLGMSVFVFGEQESGVNLGKSMKELVDYQYNNSGKSLMKQKSKDSIYAEAKDFSITNSELKKQQNIYDLNQSEKPQEDAFNYLCKKKTLLAMADKENIIVTEKEVEDYVTKLKESLAEAEPESLKQMKEIMNGFGGEEEYWKTTKELYKDSLQIKKLLQQERQNQEMKNGEKYSEEKWDTIEEKMINEWINEENIKIK